MKRDFLLIINKINKIFSQSNGASITVLNDTSLILPDQHIMALMGPNGSGKTTLINIIAGDLTPNSGNVYIDDLELTLLKPHKRSRIIGRVHQDSL